MKQLVDIDNWKRKENYLFFRNFANPYYTVTSVVDVSKAYDTSKCLGIKFSQFLMYASLKAVNEIEFLRYRQIDGKVWLFDSIRLNTAVSLPDHSFISVIVPYKSSLKEFVMSIQEQIEKVWVMHMGSILKKTLLSLVLIRGIALLECSSNFPRMQEKICRYLFSEK